MDQIVGIKYELMKSDNFEEYLKACGAGLLVRKVIQSCTPVLELIDNNDGSFTVKSATTNKDTFVTFKLDEEFEQEFPDGSEVKTVVTLVGNNKLVEVQRGKKEVTITWEFTKDRVLITFRVNGITAVRSYEAINK